MLTLPAVPTTRPDTSILRAVSSTSLFCSCHRLIWLDPLAGSDYYQPLAGGMAAAYPYIDDLVAVNDLASLRMLGELLADMAVHRSQRPDRNGSPRVHRGPAGSTTARAGVVA